MCHWCNLGDHTKDFAAAPPDGEACLDGSAREKSRCSTRLMHEAFQLWQNVVSLQCSHCETGSAATFCASGMEWYMFQQINSVFPGTSHPHIKCVGGLERKYFVDHRNPLPNPLLKLPIYTASCLPCPHTWRFWLFVRAVLVHGVLTVTEQLGLLFVLVAFVKDLFLEVRRHKCRCITLFCEEPCLHS